MARQLPQNAAAEQTLLGCLMARNDVIYQITELEPGDFSEPAHGELYKLMRDTIQAGRQASPMTLMHDFSQDRDIGGIKASEYLSVLSGMAMHPQAALDLSRTVKDLAYKRRMIAFAQDLMDEAWGAPVTHTAEAINAKYLDKFALLGGTLTGSGIRSADDVAKGVMVRLDDAFRNGTAIGLALPLAKLEELMGPWLPGRLYSIAGSAGAGKTGLVQQCSESIGIHRPVLFFQIEMPDEEMLERSMSAKSGVPSQVIERASGLNVDQYERVSEAAQTYRGLKLYIDSSTSPTIAGIRGKAVRLQRAEGLGAIVIDNLMYIQSPDPKMPEHQAIRAILQGLKKIAKDLKVPVILLVHLKQSYYDDPIVRAPRVGDIHGGAAVNQESDCLMFIYREEPMLMQREPAKTDKARADWVSRMERCILRAEFILAKRRGGVGYGKRKVGFDGARTQFTDSLPKSSDIGAAMNRIGAYDQDERPDTGHYLPL